MGPNLRIPLQVTESGCLLVLEGKVLDDLMANPRPILWNREGLYFWIPATRVRNDANRMKDTIVSKKNNNDMTIVQLVYAAVNAELLTGVNKKLAQAIEEMSKLLEDIKKAFKLVGYTDKCGNALMDVDEAICFAYKMSKLLEKK